MAMLIVALLLDLVGDDNSGNEVVALDVARDEDGKVGMHDNSKNGNENEMTNEKLALKRSNITDV